ncbi:MAG: HPF/RaiA family ribosome-associated protein [Nitrospiria bacterium]
MQHPLQITVRNMSLSDAARAAIQERVDKLDAFTPDIIGCRVLVEMPHRHQHQGASYNVRIDLTIPGAELIVKREAHEDVYVAIRDAFDAAKRQVQESRRRRRGEVKAHEESPLARVSKLFSIEGYGFLETPDGREVYFHSHSVLNGGFDRLAPGTEVRFVEEEGDQGPQASTVVPMKRQHG